MNQRIGESAKQCVGPSADSSHILMPVKNARKITALKHRKAREAEQKFMIEGIRLTEEALRSNAPVEQMVFDREALKDDDRLNQLFQEATRRKIFIQQTDRRALKHMGETQQPEGVLAVVRMPAWNRDRALESNALLLLDRIRDPGNLGLIQRTAEAAGVGALFLSSGSVELYNPKVVRASRGALFRLPVFRNEDLPALIQDLRDRSVAVFSTHLEGTPFYEIAPPDRFAFLLGNETFGIDPALDGLADETVTIPMAKGVNSLNIAVAAGILLFKFREFRRENA